MTDAFNKYIKYSYLDEDGHRWINEDAPDEIKNEVKKLDEDYFTRTGRHMIRVN